MKMSARNCRPDNPEYICNSSLSVRHAYVDSGHVAQVQHHDTDIQNNSIRCLIAYMSLYHAISCTKIYNALTTSGTEGGSILMTSI